MKRIVLRIFALLGIALAALLVFERTGGNRFTGPPTLAERLGALVPTATAREADDDKSDGGEKGDAEDAGTASGKDAPTEHEHTNRLIDEKSPYLLQHAHNPVDWYPWGEEAFEKAREENKPIFLSVGYSTCHWCHVMERESFSDPEIAAQMNENFVNIKLDREERPDVDSVYMAFVQATTGGGGWPMSVWLTPELKPFVGGTYFPPEDAFGRPGFGTLLGRIAGGWEKDEAQIRTQADQVATQLQQFTASSADETAELGASILESGLEQMKGRFDAEEGGFGAAPKFPRPSELFFLFHEAHRLGTDTDEGKQALGMAIFTLEKMAAGGMHDHLGGGFHRYSVDKRWHVPHFEKMLYDQAQLAEACLIAHQITGREDFADTARDILDYVLRDMTSEAGGFYSAEDADSPLGDDPHEKAEGVFYIWTAEEIEKALGKERAEEFAYVYGVEADGNTSRESDPHGELQGKNVLYLKNSVEEAAEHFEVAPEAFAKRLSSSRKTLFDLRAERPRPHLDDKVITAWNGLMITAFAKAHQVLGDDKYLDAANRAADFLHDKLTRGDENTLIRTWREGAADIDGFASDYAYLVRGLLDLYQTDFDTGRLEWAIALQEKQDALFWDEENGAYFSSTGKDPNVLLRMKEEYDGAEPSPNTVSTLNLLRLSHLLGNTDWSDKAKGTLDSLSTQMENSPLATPMGLVALDTYLSPAQQIVIAGGLDEDATREMLATLWREFRPGAVWMLLDGDPAREFFAGHAEFYASVGPIDDRPTAYVCRDFVCNLPTNELAVFREQLSELGTGAADGKRQ